MSMLDHSSLLTPTTLACAGALAVGGWLLLGGDAGKRAIHHLPAPPSTLPLLGNTLDLIKHMPRLHDWITAECLRFEGRVWRLELLGSPAVVVVATTEGMEDVLKTQFEVFDKGRRMTEVFADTLGDGIFAVDGDKWREQRKAYSHLFTMRQFRDTICGAIERHIRKLGAFLDDAVAADPQQWLDLGATLTRFTSDTFSEIAFGFDPDSLRTSDTRDDAYLNASLEAVRLTEARFHQPMWLWKLKRLLNVGQERALREHMQVINDRAAQVIAEALQRRLGTNSNDRVPPPTASNPSARHDVISLVLDHIDEFKDDTVADDKQAKYLRDIGFGIISAGRETTSLTLMWIIIALARHPEVLVAARTELRERLPRVFSDRGYVPTMEEVEELVYLEAVVREALRLFTVIPLNAKEANRDTTLYDGTFIKKGTAVYIPSYALGRMPCVWGPDAAEFRPERWLEEEVHDDRDTAGGSSGSRGQRRLRIVSAFQFPAFHGGPRICLGMRFALLQLKTTLAFLLSKFDFETRERPETYTYEISLGLSLKGPLLTRVRPCEYP